MRACEGYVENGKFHPIGHLLKSPDKLRAILTILDEPVAVRNKNDDKVFWAEFPDSTEI